MDGWSEMRVKAQRIEARLQSTLSDYESIGFRLGGHNGTTEDSKTASALESEITKQLSEFSDINSQMEAALRREQGHKRHLQHATFARRFREVYLSITYNFEKAKERIRTNLKRHRILEGARNRHTARPSETQSLLKERASLQSSLRQVDTTIQIANQTTSAIENQGNLFLSTQGRLA